MLEGFPERCSDVHRSDIHGGVFVAHFYNAISSNPRIKYEELENILNLGETTIRRAVKWMKQNGYIDSAHSKIKGVWQIID